MTKWILGLAALALVAVGGYFAMMMLAPPPADLDLSRSKQTAAGIYRVTIAPEREPLEQGALHGWIATVALADGKPVADAEIGIDGGMPQHGHGLPTAPQASADGAEGRYRIEGVRFNMSGWWELKLAISSPAGDDTVTFNILL